MIVVTGGAGFIGSNIVKALNERGITDIIVVDDLKDGTKFVNLVDCDIADYLDLDDFRARVAHDELPTLDAIFHEGACSATTEWDGKYIMDNNYEYTKELFHYCQKQRIPFYYASSAATYGNTATFRETPEFEGPLNVYGYSKLLFDQYLRRYMAANTLTAPAVGFRYFNVYGPREQHKGSMASVAFHHYQQVLHGESPKLFGPYDGYEAGMQSRDFIYVGDVVAANLWCFDHPTVSGIFNLGTGRAEPFRAIADTVIKFFGKGDIEFIDFPEHLKGRYQSYTCADMNKLREAGFDHEFKTVEQGVSAYLEWLTSRD